MKVPRDGLERPLPDVGRQHGLLRLRPQRAVHALRVRRQRPAPSKRARAQPRRLRHPLRLRRARRASSTSSSASSTSTTSRPGRRTPVPVTIAADLPQVRPHFEKVAARPDPARAPCRRRASACSSRRTARSSRCRPRRATCATSRAARPWPTATRRGRPTASGSHGSRTTDGRVRALLPLARRHRRPRRRSTSASRARSSTRRAGRPTARRSRSADKRLNLWLVDIEHPTPVKIDTRPVRAAPGSIRSWSPDSRWIAYEKQLDEPPHGDVHLLARGQDDPPGDRRSERRVLRALRPQRQVPLVPREHRRRARARPRHDDVDGQADDEQRLRRPC